MSEESNHINKFTAEDIRRYLSNELTEQEMHAIEKAALEDPFLADAIDGMKQAFDSHGQQQVMLELSNLKEQLSEKTREKKVVPIGFGWAKWTAAAVVLLIAGSTYFILNIRKTQEYADSYKASTAQKSAKTTQALTDTTPTITPQTPENKPPEASSRPYTKSSSAASAPAAAEAVTALEKKERNLAASKRQALYSKEEERAAASVLRRTDSISETAAASKAEVFANADIADSINDVVKTLQGKIIDPNGNPLSNVRIEAPRINMAIWSDSNGNFALRSREAVSEVNISAVGYQNANYKISESDKNQLILNPSTAMLNEAVVTGYSKGKIKPAIEKSPGEAIPSVGWVEYNRYLQQSRKIPPSNSNITSYVIVSFNVYEDGTIGKFKIEQPITEIYNREAIRLIKEGPSWKLVSGKKARVRLQVTF